MSAAMPTAVTSSAESVMAHRIGWPHRRPDGSSRFRRCGIVYRRPEISAVFRWFRLIADIEDTFQQGWLLIPPIRPDSVSNGQRSDHRRNTGQKVAGRIKDRSAGIIRQVDILIGLVRDRHLDAVFGQQLSYCLRFLGSQPFPDYNRRHVDQVCGFSVSIAKDILQQISCLDSVAGSAGNQYQSIFQRR